MKNFKKLLALGLAAAMTLSMAACGSSTDTTSTSDSGSTSTESTASTDTTASTDASTEETVDVSAAIENESGTDANGTRTINIGTWWVQHYDSGDSSLEDSEDYTTSIIVDGDDEATIATKTLNGTISQLKWDNVAYIENTYNCKFYWNNLTYTGVKESINTSIPAGTPDCDIYLVDAGMAVPAQLNGLAVDLKTVLPEDADIFTDQEIMTYMDLGDGKVSIIKRVEAQSQVEATYPLAFNLQMIEENNLEDPRDLYERGEWTWDKFNEYCQVLTQDTDGDGQIDQYGYCGFINETLENLMMSNGANIASGTTQTLDSAPMAEVLQEIYDLYNTYNVCYPYDFEGNASDSMRNQYTQGNVAFFPIAAWIAAGNDDYDYDHDGSSAGLAFDTVYVRWPVGPSGDQETNAGKNATSGELYIIPAGVEDPETVYNVLHDLWDWGRDLDGGTASLRDDKSALHWWYEVTAWDEELQNHNFEVMNDCGAHITFDLWNSMGVEYDLSGLIDGTVTPAQFQETYKQAFQDGLDAYFGG